MSPADYGTGLGYFLVVWGSVAAATVIIVRGRLSHLRGSDLVLAYGVVATAALIGVHMLPGILGVLSRASVALTAIFFVLAVRLFLRSTSADGRPETVERGPAAGSRPGGNQILWGCAIATIAVFGTEVLLAVSEELTVAATTVDTTTFHLPEVARWIQDGSLWGIHQFIPRQAHANYPHNGDVIHLATVLPWRNDAFARPIGWPYVALAGVAVYGLAQHIGARRSVSAMAGALFVCLPAVILGATGGTLTDPILAAMLGAGLVFLVRHAKTGSLSDLILAGLGLGLAFGTKWYGVSSVLAIVACWVVYSLRSSRRPAGKTVRESGVLAGLIAVCGGFWMLRNWVGSGNPFFPVKLELFGVTIFDAPPDVLRESLGFNILHYAGDLEILTGPVADGFWYGWSLPGIAVLAGALIAGVLILRRASWPHADIARTLAGLAVVLFAIYTITPYTALGFEGSPVGVGFNARYAIPAFLVAAPLFAWAASNLGSLRLPLAILALAAGLVGIEQAFEPGGREIVAALAVAVVVVAATAWLGRRGVRLPRALSKGPLVAATVGLVAVAAALGYERQKKFNEARYTNDDPVLARIALHEGEDRRVGLDGEWNVEGVAPVLPAFGPRFENEVSYIGTLDSGFLEQYGDRRSWQREVGREGFDLILIGRLVPERTARVGRWSMELGFRRLAASPRFVLMERSPDQGASLSPSGPTGLR